MHIEHFIEHTKQVRETKEVKITSIKETEEKIFCSETTIKVMAVKLRDQMKKL